MKRRNWLIAGIALFGLLTPLCLVPVLFLINSVNPMQTAFLTSITVVNQSGRTLDIVPAGTLNDGTRASLPTYYSAFPAIPRLNASSYRVEDGAEQRILFDWDDINFSQFIVRDGTGAFRQWITDPDPPLKDYYAPKVKLHTIPAFNSLETPDPLILSETLRPRGLVRSWWTLTAMALPPFFLIGFVRALRRERSDRRSVGASPS